MGKLNPWERNLEDGQRAEKIIRQKLKDWRLKISIEDHSNNMTVQQRGIDFSINCEKANIESKSRDWTDRKYMLPEGDVLFELEMIGIDWQKKGWYYTTKADLLAYSWWNPLKTDLYEAYLITIQDPRLRTWFEKELHNFEKVKAPSVAEGGRKWDTFNAVVPIPLFPEGTLFQLIKQGKLGFGFHLKTLDSFFKDT